MTHTRGGSPVDQRDMYHIFAPQGHRQYGSSRRQNQTLRFAAADSPGLVELAVAVRACISGVQQQVNLAAAGGDFDLFAAGEQGACAGFEPEPVERGLAQGGLDPLAEIGRNLEFARFEGAGERALELALGLIRLERRTVNTDPRTPAGRLGANVGKHRAVRPERKPDQPIARAMLPRQDTGPLRPLALLRKQKPFVGFA
jgi:hypothetical protein